MSWGVRNRETLLRRAYAHMDAIERAVGSQDIVDGPVGWLRCDGCGYSVDAFNPPDTIENWVLGPPDFCDRCSTRNAQTLL